MARASCSWRGQASSALGSLGYMAPEQASMGKESSPDVAWDVYGLGATVYTLLTGQVPRLGPTERRELSTISDHISKL